MDQRPFPKHVVSPVKHDVAYEGRRCDEAAVCDNGDRPFEMWLRRSPMKDGVNDSTKQEPEKILLAGNGARPTEARGNSAYGQEKKRSAPKAKLQEVDRN